MAAADILSQTNEKIFGAFKGGGQGLLRAIGWLVFILIAVGGGIAIYYSWKNKKKYDKTTTHLMTVGDYFQPAFKDKATTVKLGTGGFEILYLQKKKTWRIAYGGRVGMKDYYFFQSPDGYWYNSMFYGKIEAIDEHGGLIPVVTANPLMRGQYTSLEKQIDALHAEKKSFMEKYGQWVFAISFVLIAGFMLFLCYKQFASAMSSLGGFLQQQNNLYEKLNILAGNVAAAAGAPVPIPV